MPAVASTEVAMVTIASAAFFILFNFEQFGCFLGSGPCGETRMDYDRGRRAMDGESITVGSDSLGKLANL